MNANTYPDHNELTPQKILKTAMDYLDKKDYGAALFYGNFAVKIGSFYNHLAEEGFMIVPVTYTLSQFIDYAESTVKSANSSIEKDLEKRMEEMNIHITPKNKQELIEKHSPHNMRYRELQEKLGIDYFFRLK